MRGITRRSFPGLGAVAMTTAMSAVKAGQGQPASARAVRAALLGTGHGHANSKARVLREMDSIHFVGVCRPDARDPIRGDEFQRVTWLSLPQILDDPTVELVAVVGADAHWNLDYAQRCVQAGKHVHLDKPPGASLSGLRDLLAEAKRRGVLVQMGYQWRYHPGMEALQQAVREGWLGDVYRFRASIDKPILPPERKELAHYRGGMMFSEGCHLVDQATAALGEPERVKGFLQQRSGLRDGLVDNALVVLEYPTALAEISMAGYDPYGGEHRYVEVLGTNGLARVTPFAPLRLQVKLREAAGPYRQGDQTLEPENPRGYPYRPDFQEMVDCIRQGGKPRFTMEHDLMTHRVLLEACGML